jgi:hypothetical protein
MIDAKMIEEKVTKRLLGAKPKCFVMLGTAMFVHYVDIPTQFQKTRFFH